MVTTVREGKEQFEELVKRASGGEEVLITENGEVQARITRPESIPVAARIITPIEREQRIEDLDAIREEFSAFSAGRSCQEIIDEMREERF